MRRAYGTAVGLSSLAGIAHAFAATVGQFVAARAALAVIHLLVPRIVARDEG